MDKEKAGRLTLLSLSPADGTAETLTEEPPQSLPLRPGGVGKYYNWIKHNKKLLNAGELKPERVDLFNQLLNLRERYRRVNQYECVIEV